MYIGLTGLMASIDRMGGQPQRAEADGSDALTGDIAVACTMGAELV